MRNGLLALLLLFSGVIKAQDIDVLHYAFMLTLSDDNDTIAGVTNITFVLKRDSGIVSFDLVNVRQDGKGMRASLVTDGYHNSAPLSFMHAGRTLTIQMPQAKKNDTCNIFITYQGIPADGLTISRNKFGERTFFSDNWPNRAHHWLPCHDRPDDKASFEFIISAPPHYSVISNGKKTEEKTEGLRKITHWQEDIPLPTKVMAIGVARFATKTFADSPEQVPVSAWVYPQDSTKGFYDYALTPGIVKFFSDYIAPFPFAKLANVQSTTIFGGMENASCIFYDENSVTGDRSAEALMSHEVAHQWFGDMASEKSFAHVWLSEGFATYLTHLYWEQQYGKEAMQKRLQQDRKKVVQFAKEYPGAVIDSSDNLMSLLNTNSYQKGGWVLHMLRNEVGDSTFQKIIQAYYHEYKGGNADSRDFQAVAERVSGKDLKEFFDQWVYRPGIPKFKIVSKIQGNEMVITVLQTGEPFQLTLPIELKTTSGETLPRTLSIKEKKSLFRIPVKNKNVKPVIDPQTTVLCEVDYN